MLTNYNKIAQKIAVHAKGVRKGGFWG